MTSIYKRGTLLLLILNICFSIILTGQTPGKDSVINKQDLIKNVAYGIQPSWKTSGPVTTVKGSELQKSFTTNLANRLIGRLPGLTIRQSNGETGYDSPTLNVRGLNTFGPNPQPLYIIDGFEATYEQLVPEEIESITLLKDASETAIYGLRGANGVLLVTTKRGKVSPLKVEVSTQQGIQSPINLPSFLGSYDYANLYNEGLANEGIPAKYTQADLDAYKNGSDPYMHPNVNWYDVILKKSAPISNYNVNFTGGNNSVRYFVLFNAISSNGLYINSGDKSKINSTNSTYAKYNFRSNVDIQISKIFSAALILGGSVEEKANPFAINTASVFNKLSFIPPNSFPVLSPDGSYVSTTLISNPLGDMLNTGFFTSSSRTMQSTFQMKADLDDVIKGLSASGAISFNNYFRGFSSKSRTYESVLLSKNLAGDYVSTTVGLNSSLASSETANDQWRNYGFQTFLNYNRTFGIHQLDAMLMLNSDNWTSSGTALPVRHVGYGGRFNYAYNEKYVGELSFGYYGTDNFEKGKQYGFFPSLAIGWIVSKEEFLKGSNVVNYLKIRGSYGLAGNDKIGGARYMFNDYYTGLNSYYFGQTTNSGASTIGEGIIANHGVTWEKQKQMNIGFEATMFHHIDVSLNVFNQDRSDILSTPNLTVPLFTGASLPTLNVGKTNNKGLEATIRFNSDESKELKFFVQADMWYAKNKIVYNSEALQQWDYLYRTGRQIGQPFVLEAIGFFADAADIANSPHQTFTAVQPGDIKYKDQNGDGIINQNDFYPIGNSDLPKLTSALHAGLSYKGFDLDVFLQGVSGRTIYLGGYYYQAFQNNGKVSEIALGRWTPESASTATYPRLSASNNLNNYQNSSFWQRDGSFIKLRSIELGYTIPKNITGKLKMDNVRVFINGTNLLTFDRVDFVNDPESLSGYPTLRTISLGAKIQF